MKHTFNKYPVTGADGYTYTAEAHTEAEALAKCGDGARITGEPEIVPYTLAPVVAGVVAALGEGWDAEPMSDEHAATGFALFHKDGAQMWIHGPGYGHPKAYRVGLMGWIRDASGKIVNVDTPDAINVSTEKSPEQVARDISRRLLPQARDVAARLLEARDKADQAAGGKAAIVSELGRVLGVEPRGQERDRFYVSGFDFEVGYGGGSVGIKAYSVPRSLAVKIAALVVSEGGGE